MFKIKVADKETETILEPALTQEEALYWYQVIMERMPGVSIDLEGENELICPDCKSNNTHMLALGKFNSDWYRCQDCFYRWSP